MSYEEPLQPEQRFYYVFAQKVYKNMRFMLFLFFQKYMFIENPFAKMQNMVNKKNIMFYFVNFQPKPKRVHKKQYLVLTKTT